MPYRLALGDVLLLSPVCLSAAAGIIQVCPLEIPTSCFVYSFICPGIIGIALWQYIIIY